MQTSFPTQREAYENYITSDHWKDLRSRALALAGNRCENCGSGTALHGHHLQYRDFYDCTTDDIMALCHCCHAKWHERYRSWDRATRQQVLDFLRFPNQKKGLKRPKPKPMGKKERKSHFKKGTEKFSEISQALRVLYSSDHDILALERFITATVNVRRKMFGF